MSLSHPQYDHIIQIFVVITKFSVGTLQIVSVAFLGYGIYLIQNRVNSADCTDQINVKILVLHLLAFGLYLLCTLNYYVFFALYYLGDGGSLTLFIAIAVSNILSFFEQLFLCYIFLQLTRHVEEPVPTR
jgi:hypothetical protein